MLYELEYLLESIFSNPILALIFIAIVIKIANNYSRKTRIKEHNMRLENIRMRNKENHYKKWGRF